MEILGLLMLYLVTTVFDTATCERSCKDGKPLKPYPETIKNTTLLLEQLRQLMKDNGIDGYIIPSADDHQTEYVAPWFKRRSFISGFKGSVGTAVVTLNSAAVWVDGRYHEQADFEVDCNWIIQKQGLSGVPSITKWIQQELNGKTIGADPRVISINYKNFIQKKLGSIITWKNVNDNLIDSIWTNRPVKTHDHIFIQPDKYAGKSFPSKIDNLRKEITSKNTVAIVVQALDDVAWLLNLRGKDIPYNPFFYGYIIVTQKNISLFVDLQKVTESVKTHLCPSIEYCVEIHDYNYTIIGEEIKKIANSNNGSIWLTSKASVLIAQNVPMKQQTILDSPIQLPKAMKNTVEIAGMKTANIRDGIAIMEYFVWLQDQIAAGNRVTELSGAEQLKNFKSKQENFVGLSFGTISGFGANGAIIHYKANNLTDTQITDKSLYLLDSGAQFPEGSTDITRTIHLGTPTKKQMEMFTYVLKGSIGLARAIFPTGTYGRNIDVYAREYLWRKGLDYRHGTGHGIGSFLSIHEGPGRINTGKSSSSEAAMYEGMIFSDEPGYYQSGEFGIRLETAICVQPRKTVYTMKGRSFYGFDVITWVPFERKLINIDMLDDTEIQWLNKYYKDIRTIMGGEIKKQGKENVYKYMMAETEPITRLTKASSTKSTASVFVIFLLTFLVVFH